MDKDDWYFIGVLILLFLVGQGILTLFNSFLDWVYK